MKPRIRTLREWNGQGVIRYRTRWRATKTLRSVWTEFTNQPGDRDWRWNFGVYNAHANPSGFVTVDATSGSPMSRVAVDRLTLDLRDLIEAAESWNASRRSKR